jgi:hypothetical protein
VTNSGKPDFGRIWVYRARTPAGKVLATTELGDDGDARVWAVEMSHENDEEAVIVERWDSAHDIWIVIAS